GVGRKVGYANKAMWRVLKLETLVWARMYDDTIIDAPDGEARVSVAGRVSPKIEPEIVFGLGEPIDLGAEDAESFLRSVEWMALGFEVNDCVFPDWKFQPVDFVAALGFHTALVIGPRRRLDADSLAATAAALSTFTLQLTRNAELVEEGSGKAALKSPALC